MSAPWRLVAGAALFVLVTGCLRDGGAGGPAATVRPADPATAPADPAAPVDVALRIDRRASIFTRGVLAVDPGDKVRVTVEGPDMATPYTKDVTLSGGIARIQDVPPGALRIATVQFLDAGGQPLEGVLYRGHGKLGGVDNSLVLDNLSTLSGGALLAIMKQSSEEASKLPPSLARLYAETAVLQLGVSSPRFIDPDGLASKLRGLTTKDQENLPSPDPAWVRRPGVVDVSFLNVPTGAAVRAAVLDPTSNAGLSVSGEALRLEPVFPSDQPRKLKVQVVPTGTELIGPELVRTDLTVTVKAGEAKVVEPVSFATSTAGVALPERVGDGGGVAVGEELWLLNPIFYEPSAAGEVHTQPADSPARPSRKAFRFTRAGGWTTPIADVPVDVTSAGAAFAVAGKKVFAFGGASGGAFSAGVHRFDLDGTPAANATVAALPGDVGLFEAAAAFLGDRIYVAGGITADKAFDKTLAFNPSTAAFDAANFPGPADPLRASASAVGPDGKWYLFGGAKQINNDDEPQDTVQAFDPATKSWSAVTPAMPTPRVGATAVVHDGKIWVIGGEGFRGGALGDVEVFDPTAKTWTRRAPMRTPRSFAAAAAIKKDGKAAIVVAGGTHGVAVTGFRTPLPPNATEELQP